jgi:CubicO group peptidase (beta-lactamase class C family)
MAKPKTRRTVLKELAIGATALLASDAFAESVVPSSQRKRISMFAYNTPESLGIESSAILAFIEAAEKQLDSLHSFVLVRHGQVAAEGGWSPYGVRTPHMLFSLSKSFTSTAVGLAVSEEHLTVEDRVVSFFPNDAPSQPDENLAAMRVRDLLTMTPGHDKDTLPALFGREDGNWAKAFLSQPVEHKPGTHFVYNSGASYMLSAIVQKVTGKKVRDYLEPRLFGPLGIKGAPWETCPRGINTGGWGLTVSAEDIARFGKLYIQKGMWEGKRLLPEEWVKAATSKQVPNGSGENSDWEQGYGYQFWQCRHGAYRGDGAFGQFCVVLPEKDAVVAITSGMGDMQAVLNLIWQHLLPGMKSDTLPESSAASEVKAKLARLAFPPQSGSASSAIEKQVSNRSYAFETNDQKIKSAALQFGDKQCVLTVQNDRGEHKIPIGNGHWIKGETALLNKDSQKVAASGAWTDPNTYVMKLCLYETPFVQTLTCQFEDNQVTLGMKANVGFGPTEAPKLVGRAA